MKYEESQKITALGVVIFSFIAIMLALLIIALFDMLAAFLVLKTSLPESILKAGSVVGSGAGLIVSTALLTKQTGMKGIITAAIMAAAIALIKILGNMALGLGGYFTLNGFIGLLFTVVFSLIGGVLGANMKR